MLWTLAAGKQVEDVYRKLEMIWRFDPPRLFALQQRFLGVFFYGQDTVARATKFNPNTRIGVVANNSANQHEGMLTFFDFLP